MIKHIHEEYDTISLDISSNPTFILDIGNPLCDLSGFLRERNRYGYETIALEGIILRSSSKEWIKSISNDNPNVEILKTCTIIHNCNLDDSSDDELNKYFI